MSTYKGSKRCVLELISSSDFLIKINSLISSSNAIISGTDNWMPKGLHNDEEAELKDFLAVHFSPSQGVDIKDWWLKISTTKTRTPNWDLVSTCTIDNKKGLLLVEAKAHWFELENESKGKILKATASDNSKANHESISLAIEEANIGINKVVNGVSISRNNCYQLSNRIAHAWWLANLGIPVILLYLGFLKSQDMNNGKNIIFNNDSDWETCFINHSKKIGADKIIDKWINCGKSSFITLYKSLLL